MATELITRTWCDTCLGERDERVDARHSEAIGVGSAVRSLDLCEDCYTILLAPVVDALKRFGNPVTPGDRPAQPTPPTRRGFDCPRCDKSPPTRGAFRAHLKNTHKLDPATVSRICGGTIPCPDCPFMALDSTGLAVHRRSAHPDLFAG